MSFDSQAAQRPGADRGPDSQAPPKVQGGLVRILNDVHDKRCTLGKNARLVAIAIAWRMGRRQAAILGVRGIMEATGLGRSAVSIALAKACAPGGVLVKTRRGRGNCNQYEPRPDRRAGTMEATGPGRSGVSIALTQACGRGAVARHWSHWPERGRQE